MICLRNGENYEKAAHWVGFGHKLCTDPKLLWESIVARPEELIAFIELKFYDGKSKESYPTIEKINKILSILDSTNGRCYSIKPNIRMIRRGIRKIEIGFASLCRVYVHTPGKYAPSRKVTRIRNRMGIIDYIDVEHGLYEMKNEG